MTRFELELRVLHASVCAPLSRPSPLEQTHPLSLTPQRTRCTMAETSGAASLVIASVHTQTKILADTACSTRKAEPLADRRQQITACTVIFALAPVSVVRAVTPAGAMICELVVLWSKHSEQGYSWRACRVSCAYIGNISVDLSFNLGVCILVKLAGRH